VKDIGGLRDLFQTVQRGLWSPNDKRECRCGALLFDAGSKSVDVMTPRLVEPNETGTPTPRCSAIEAKLISLGA
jgi:hypothetical protein